MKSKITIIVFLLWTVYSCKAQNSDKNTTNRITSAGKIISTGYWVPDKVQEIKGLKHGPFIRLADGNVLTADGNQTYISRDEGRTWSAYSLIADTAKFTISVGALIRTRKNVIILSFSNLKEKANWNWQKDIHDSPGSVLPTYAVRSMDGGKTWEAPEKLHEEWTGANRDMIETKDGSIVFTSMIMRHHPGHHTVLTYTSKDEGKTWTASNIIDLGGSGSHSGVMESTLVQLKDGRLWMLLRTDWGDFWQTFSDDDGITWKETGPTNIDASSSPGMIKRLKSGRLVLVWNRLFPEGQMEYPLQKGDGNLSDLPTNWQRKELSIMFSDNDGKNWSKPVVIAKVTKKGAQLSYPFIFEAKPGELWITTSFGGGLGIKLYEKDFIVQCR
ncbi:MAG TPA: sialidase family protein [Hanamia sp.]|nr:sialidase family protein [Hanamia sp.]